MPKNYDQFTQSDIVQKFTVVFQTKPGKSQGQLQNELFDKFKRIKN